MNILQALLTEGMKGEPLPYMPRLDWVNTSLLFLCIFMVCYVLSKERSHLQQQIRYFFSAKERGSFFDDATATDMRHTLVLIFHTCILLGFCAYHYCTHSFPALLNEVNHALLLGIFVLVMIVYMLAKWGIYSFVNWVFFDKTRNMLWVNSYFFIIIWLGLVLLPVILLSVYFSLLPPTSFLLIALAVFLAKILLFYKCFSNFFQRIHGLFHLILYFCTLEILPDLLLWKGIILSCNNLILNI